MSCWSREPWVIVVLRRIGRGDASTRSRWHLDGRPVRNEPRVTSLYGIPSRGTSSKKQAGASSPGRGPNRTGCISISAPHDRRMVAILAPCWAVGAVRRACPKRAPLHEAKTSWQRAQADRRLPRTFS